MRQRLTRALLVVSVIVILLLLPVLFKDKGRPAIAGPDLSETVHVEVFFENERAGLKLSGMLFVPDGSGPFPTAVIIHGSGPSRRNNAWYLSVAQHLQRNGIAVLLPDKRGSEKSEGEWIGASFEELATDTSSAIAYVKRQQRFTPSAIGLVGMSQGGWIAPLVAAKSDRVSFVVSMSGATVTTDEQLLYEEIHNISHYTYMFIAKLLAPITAANIKKKDYFRAYAGFDSIPHWKRIGVPVFFAFGENDENVPVEASIDRLKKNGLSHHRIQVYPDGGHGIVDSQTNGVSAAYLDDLVAFIRGA